VKLSVVSTERGRPQSIRDERLCKRTLGMGAMVFNASTGKAGPLPDEATTALVDTVREYQGLCTLDGGTVVAAGATQWARDATNINDVIARVRRETGVTMEVLTAAQEAEYAYIAGAAGAPGRIVLDPGSNSFELAWQPRSAGAISSVLVAYGYVRASTNDMERAKSYAEGRVAYGAKVRAMLNEQLAKLNPPMTLSDLGALVRAGRIGPEIITLGLDGASHLWVRGLMRTATGWVSDSGAFDAVLRRQPLESDPQFGTLAAAPLGAAELQRFFDSVTPQDFRILTTDPVRSLYGQKALVVPALAALLLEDLGATRLVMVPQENSTGNILAKLTAAGR
jgi:hypothetical protein